MTRFILLLFISVSAYVSVFGQTITSGLTGKRDTSYTTWSAYRKMLKDYTIFSVLRLFMAVFVRLQDVS